ARLRPRWPREQRGEPRRIFLALPAQHAVPLLCGAAAIDDGLYAHLVARHARADIVDALAQALRLRRGGGLFLQQAGEQVALRLRLPRERRLALSQLLEALAEPELFLGQALDAPDQLLAELAGAAQPLVQVRQPIATALELGLQRRHPVVCLVRAARCVLGSRLDARRLGSRLAELVIALIHAAAQLLGTRREPGTVLVLVLPHHEQLEQAVRRLVQRQVLELLPVFDEAVRLRGLALE